MTKAGLDKGRSFINIDIPIEGIPMLTRTQTYRFEPTRQGRTSSIVGQGLYRAAWIAHCRYVSGGECQAQWRLFGVCSAAIRAN